MTTTPWNAVAAIALIGVIVGAFLNVLIDRLPSDEPIAYPSAHCEACATELRPRFNLPIVGWLLLGNRCPICGDGISQRPVLVEAGSGVMFAALTVRFGLTVELPPYLYLASVGIAVAAIESEVRRVPDAIVLPSYVISLLLLMPASASAVDWWPAARALAGLLALSFIYAALVVAYPSGMSLGDVKLAGLLGLYLGWLSWGALLIGAFGGLLLCSVGGMTMQVMRGRHGVMVMAYGPCMVAAAGIAVFATTPLTGWYGSLVAAT